MVHFPHAKPNLCPSAHLRRAPGHRARPAVGGCLYPAALSGPPCQCAWRHPERNRPTTELWRPDRPQRHPCLQSAGLGRPTTGLDRGAAFATYRLRRGWPGALADSDQAQPAHLWPGHQRLDARSARRGLLCRATHAAPSEWRNHPRNPQAPRHRLEAGQALDSQSRPGLHPQKNRRDRLIRLAATHPRWALGFGDEVWWSRFAPPDVHAWQPDDAPVRLVEQARPKQDGDPKALACYGLLVRQPAADAPTARSDRMLLRFVDGRPVSSVTIDFLHWCNERLAAAGKTAMLLIWDNASWHISKAVRGWIGAHNWRVKQGQPGVRIVLCL